jgi:hypothetical protein
MPTTLIAFAWATLLAVGGVVVLAGADDRIALALHTHGPHRYRERDLRAEVERRFDRPVIALEPGG